MHSNDVRQATKRVAAFNAKAHGVTHRAMCDGGGSHGLSSLHARYTHQIDTALKSTAIPSAAVARPIDRSRAKPRTRASRFRVREELTAAETPDKPIDWQIKFHGWVIRLNNLSSSLPARVDAASSPIAGRTLRFLCYSPSFAEKRIIISIWISGCFSVRRETGILRAEQKIAGDAQNRSRLDFRSMRSSHFLSH